MTRKHSREFAMQILFTLGFESSGLKGVLEERLSEAFFERLTGVDELYGSMPDGEESAYIARLVTGVYEHGAELDGYIEKYAVGWRFGRLPRVAVAVMRVCMFEVLYMHEIPPKASMNEAVEIAKKYEPADVVAFINGIIGSFYKGEVMQ
ncbi:MAG: transcription antitermination factor NusB [Oscillospiraceae bacterium]|nr:transcription antitermination factor NusB [Oscillospiraceae bacterium]